MIENIIGILGVLLILAAYALLNLGKLLPTNLVYLLLNASGSSCILISLMFSWNLSSVVMQIAWISISLIGVFRSLRSRKQAKANPGNLYLLREHVSQ